MSLVLLSGGLAALLSRIKPFLASYQKDVAKASGRARRGFDYCADIGIDGHHAALMFQSE
jgi:hypothetical protein